MLSLPITKAEVAWTGMGWRWRGRGAWWYGGGGKKGRAYDMVGTMVWYGMVQYQPTSLERWSSWSPPFFFL